MYQSQQIMASTKHNIYWWNLENLFDIENSPTRPDYLQNQLKSELKGWSSQVLDRKIINLCSVIRRMNNNLGPDILGVCEVENEEVITRLADRVSNETGRNYKIMHHDTKDRRGIDIAVIYDRDIYSDDGSVYTLEVMKRNATRDLFQINLSTSNGNKIYLIGNHWPARMGGQYESEPYRIIVAETLSYWIERIYEVNEEQNANTNPSIVIMGDFNDNPYDRSLTKYLRTTPIIEKVKNSTSHILFNTMYGFLNRQLGTHVYGNEVNVLDQFILSKSFLVSSNANPFDFVSTDIIQFPNMVKGDYNTPIRYSRPSKSDYNPDGYSDHLPIELVIKENH